MQTAPAFGKRSAAPSRGPTTAAPAARDHAAFFAAARAEQSGDTRPRAVPRSFRAALLAGLVVGCCLAGLDATNASATLRALSGGVLSIEAAPRLLPVVVALALLGGARAAATSLLIAHAVLRRLRLTSHVAYALGSGAVALAVSLLATMLAQAGLIDASLATHGLAFDVSAGIAAGFLYRVFAGAAPTT